jgi:hypothetical protein
VGKGWLITSSCGLAGGGGEEGGQQRALDAKGAGSELDAIFEAASSRISNALKWRSSGARSFATPAWPQAVHSHVIPARDTAVSVRF